MGKIPLSPELETDNCYERHRHFSAGTNVVTESSHSSIWYVLFLRHLISSKAFLFLERFLNSFAAQRADPSGRKNYRNYCLQSPGSQDGAGRGHWGGIAELSHAGWPLDMGAAEKPKEKHLQSEPSAEANFINWNNNNNGRVMTSLVAAVWDSAGFMLFWLAWHSAGGMLVWARVWVGR